MVPLSIEDDSLSNSSKKYSFFSMGNYPYVTARVRAKKALLLSSDVYQKLLMMDEHQIIRFIGEGQYKKEITELSVKYSGSELAEVALNKNLAEVYHQILGYSEGDLHEMLSAYMERDDVFNIKTITRGKSYNATNEEIMKAIRSTGKYPEEYWKEIVDSSKKIEDVIDNLEGNEYYQTLIENKEECIKNSSFCENRLEIAYHLHLLNSIPENSEPNKLFLNFVKKEIDIINIKTLLITKFRNLEPEKISELIIPNGEIPEKKMKELIRSTDFKQFFEGLKKLPYYETIQKEIKTIEESGSLNNVIRLLEKDFLAKATKSSYLHPLSILPVLDYMIRKKIETENLRILVRGKEKGLSDQTIKEMLVLQ